MVRSFELIVIGGGSAGHAAARKGSELGLKTALVEAAETLGGLCILRGCMPSKTLIAAADRMRDVRTASDFHVAASEPQLDQAGLRDWLNGLIAEFQQYREAEMNKADYELIRDRASFLDPHTIQLEQANERLRGETFVIATGSSPVIPEIDGIESTPYWTSDDVTRFPDLPPRIAIIGAGVVGMEFAHLYEGLGSEVTVLCHSKRILKQFPESAGQLLVDASRERGIDFRFETEAKAVSHQDGVFHLSLSDGSSLECDALLVATGRKPVTGSLALEKAGISAKHGRIGMDDRAATNLAHIFAAGDCASPVPVVHLAVIQGEVAARNAASNLRNDGAPPAEWRPKLQMHATFTRPEIISIGHPPDQLDESTHGVCSYDFDDLGKGNVLQVDQGYVRIFYNKTDGTIVGAHAVGPGVIDSSHVMVAAIGNGMTIDDLKSLPFYHPTLVEIWSYALDS